MRAVRMSTIDVPLHAVTHVLQISGQWAETMATEESIEEINSVDVVNSGMTGSIREELECVTEQR